MTSKQRQDAKKRIQEGVHDMVIVERALSNARQLGKACLSLNKRFKFGEKRLTEFLSACDEENEIITEWEAEDVADQLLARDLRSLGLDSLAETIESLSDERRRWEGI